MIEDLDGRLERRRAIHSPEAVDAAVDAMARAVTADLEGLRPVLLCVLTGGLRLTSELMVRLPFALELDHVCVARYGKGVRGTDLEWRAFPQTELRDRHVLLCDDILDEGVTLEALRDWCDRQEPASVRAAVLVRKRVEPQRDVADYVGLDVPDAFVVGEGMDAGGFGRNLRGIHALGD